MFFKGFVRGELFQCAREVHAWRTWSAKGGRKSKKLTCKTSGNQFFLNTAKKNSRALRNIVINIFEFP